MERGGGKERGREGRGREGARARARERERESRTATMSAPDTTWNGCEYSTRRAWACARRYLDSTCGGGRLGRAARTRERLGSETRMEKGGGV